MSIAIWIAGFLLLWAPGFLIRRALRLMRREDQIVRLAVDIALGLCAWPIAILLTSMMGISWSSMATRIIAGATILAAILFALAELRGVVPPTPAAQATARTARRRGRRRHTYTFLSAFGVLAVIAVITRLIHIRDLAFPPWIDSVHHGMIVRLFLDQGRIPATCDPYIPGAAFYYHWGYHAMTAILGRLLGLTSALDVPTLMLHFGQLLNVLSAVTVYAAGRVVARSRLAGLFAATLAMFASWYPAYYLSWGRYTHLAGTLILPPLLIVLWRIGQGRRQWSYVAVATILAAGLVLVHVRIAFFAAVFAMMLVPVILIRGKRNGARLLRFLLAGAIAAIIVAPWMLRVARNEYVRDFVRPAAVATDDYHQLVPIDLVWSNRVLFSTATGGVTGVAGILGMPPGGRILSAAWLAALVWGATRKRAEREPRRRAIRAQAPKSRMNFGVWPSLLFIAAYGALVAVLLIWQPFGLNLSRFASPASAVLTLFLPLAIISGAVAAWLLQRVVPRDRVPLLSYVAMLVVALIGAWQYRTVVNPETIFTDARDLRALRWLQTNTPASARFAIDGRPWTVRPAWAGIDGGYWINVATDRRTILPPSLYAWSLPPAGVAQINGLAERWSIPQPGREAESWAAIRQAGVTHVFVGSKTPEPRRASVLASSEASVIYRDGSAIVLALR